jgi:hypothetical protein
MEETRPSIMALWGNDGNVTHEDAKTCIRLTGQEVLPRLREIGKSLGLNSPFELNTPVSLAASRAVRRLRQLAPELRQPPGGPPMADPQQ